MRKSNTLAPTIVHDILQLRAPKALLRCRYMQTRAGAVRVNELGSERCDAQSAWAAMVRFIQPAHISRALAECPLYTWIAICYSHACAAATRATRRKQTKPPGTVWHRARPIGEAIGRCCRRTLPVYQSASPPPAPPRLLYPPRPLRPPPLPPQLLQSSPPRPPPPP